MKDLSWTTLSSEYIFRESWFTIRKDKCQTADGKIIFPYYVYEFPSWVTAVAVTREGKLALERELLEETGYSFEKFEYLGKTSANPSTNNNWMHIFLATGGTLVQEQQL